MERDFLLSNQQRTLVLVGRTGNGKSATGNTIIGSKVFQSSAGASGVTRVSNMRTTTVNGRTVNVIDTPGLFDGINDAGKEIVRCIDMAKEGIHAIILVFSARARSSEEEKATFLTLKVLFGSEIVDYMVVLFTGGDDLEADGKTLDSYCVECPPHLQDILTFCGNRKILFNNRINDENKRLEQIQQLLSLTDSIIWKNGGQPFTNELFERLQKRATDAEKAETRKTQKRLEKRYDKELKRMANVIQKKLEEEIAKLRIMLEEEKVARVKVEENYKSYQISSNREIEKLKMDLQKANSGSCAIL